MAETKVGPSLRQIGTVEILKDRTYLIDPNARYSTATEAVVPPGVYPLYEYGDTRFFMLEGQLSLRNFRLGDGLFMTHTWDVVIEGLTVRFPSYSFGPDEWKEFMEKPVCNPGPEQRLVIGLLGSYQ